MNRVHYIAIAAGAVIIVAGASLTEWMGGFKLFNSGGWGIEQSQAQSQRPPAQRPAAPAPSQAASPSPAQSPAAPATQRTERTVYDSWVVTCSETVEKTSKKTCSAVLQMVEEKQNQVLMVWVIGRDNQGVLRTVIQSPTGVQIQKGLELRFGNGPVRTLPYTACTPKNCEASMAMDDAMVRDATASPEATASITAVDGRTINFKIGIKGIDRAFVALGK